MSWWKIWNWEILGGVLQQAKEIVGRDEQGRPTSHTGISPKDWRPNQKIEEIKKNIVEVYESIEKILYTS